MIAVYGECVNVVFNVLQQLTSLRVNTIPDAKVILTGVVERVLVRSRK